MKTIASIYFHPVFAERPLFRDANQWGFRAVARDAEPSLLHIVDGYQMEKQPLTTNDVRITVPAADIAADLVREWTTNAPGMSAQCRPGIWICEGNKPTTEEMVLAKAVQAAWAEWLILTGDQKHADPKTRGEITPLMRDACRYMGREREWLQELKDAEIKVCPYCTKTIRADAIVCEHCHNVVDVDRYAAMKAKLDSALSAKAPAAVPLPPPIQAPQQPRAAR